MVVMSSEDYFPHITGMSIEEYTYYDHIRQFKFKEEFNTNNQKETEKIQAQILQQLQEFPKKAEKAFAEIGIFNKRDPIAEMDAWAETQKKDIKWVEREAKEILKEQANVYIKKGTDNVVGRPSQPEKSVVAEDELPPKNEGKELDEDGEVMDSSIADKIKGF